MAKKITSNPEKSTHYREAGTGRFVKKEYAEKHPKTTVKETDKGGTDDTGPRKK